MNPYVSTLLILYAPYPLWPSELPTACVSKVIVTKRITHFSEHGWVGSSKNGGSPSVDISYRVIHLLGKNLPLTWIWDVPPLCLSSK